MSTQDAAAARGRGGLAVGRSLALSLLAVPAFLLGLGTVVLLAATAVGVGLLLFPPAVGLNRAVAGLYRRVAGRWSGVPIPRPYLDPPPGAGPAARLRRAYADPATWRDLAWLHLALLAGWPLAALPVLLLGYACAGPVLAIVGQFTRVGFGTVWFIDGPFDTALVLAEAAALAALGWTLAPAALRAHARFARLLLAPTRASALALRVRQLTATRTEVVDARAAELRRIERDLHDGAQARLVALGMSLGLADELLTSDPEAARALVREARTAANAALAELRDLVRGIHPPVLADRGLAGAVRALALELEPALAVDVAVTLPGRPAAPVESAVYFAVAEALANVVKHAGAARVGIDVRYVDGEVRVVVSDDGRGGAVVGGGSGLVGVAGRLRAFDGVLVVESPVGGPTTVLMTVAAELDSGDG
ncbi:histidine kinase [Pilimelia anulata]|uniref:histidine kinase n=1 Tax=Pilimelia anulata TaxID=53371 RepID=A0A8J3B186_9ACTN|nr:sensor domain-containing protein [Pilimelia anulata]GGJ84254.1 histidine kinase [Pilimelia anulata]